MKIGIVALGLIGGSILKSLAKIKTENNLELYCVTRNLKTIMSAKKFSDKISNKLDILKDCELIFVCTPMNKTFNTLKNLEKIVPKTTTITDVCSLKEFLMKKSFEFNFIGSHPMAGTENTGFSASFADLFSNSKWIITPKPDYEESDGFEKLENIIKLTGAKPILMSAKAHDKAVAKISHAPMFISQALFQSVSNDKFAMKLASSGFRDMTRLALSNTEMAQDMIDLNGKNIEKSLENLISALQNLKNNYHKKIEKIKIERSAMYDNDGKNIL